MGEDELGEEVFIEGRQRDPATVLPRPQRTFKLVTARRH